MMKLYYAEVLNPRKVCAVARHLHAPVEYVHVDLARGETRKPAFTALNPNGKVPVLQDGERVLWESNAIMCRLSDVVGADLWPHDERQIEVLRWLFWDAQHFSRYASRLYFEYVIKPRLLEQSPDAAAADEALGYVRTYMGVLDAHLKDRRFVVSDSLSVADFAIGVTLPYAETARIPYREFPAVARWYERLEALPAWRDPFPTTH